MSYSIQIDEAAGESLRRAAREQAGKALDELGRDDKPVSWRVHQLRKRCKKIRAVARLIRPCFDDYKQSNRFFRDIAKRLSDERDARVMFELVDDVIDDAPGQIDEPCNEPIVRWHRLRSRLADTGAARQLPELEQAMARGAVSVESWDVTRVDAHALLDGLQKTLQRAQDAHEAVREDPSVKRFHELRERCKYHWYHLRLLRPLVPPDLAERESLFDELGDLLGDAHDGSMLLDHGKRLPSFVREQPSSRWVFAQVLERRRRLREEALNQCRSAFDLPADRLRNRLADHWRFQAQAPVNDKIAVFRREGRRPG